MVMLDPFNTRSLAFQVVDAQGRTWPPCRRCRTTACWRSRSRILLPLATEVETEDAEPPDADARCWPSSRRLMQLSGRHRRPLLPAGRQRRAHRQARRRSRDLLTSAIGRPTATRRPSTFARCVLRLTPADHRHPDRAATTPSPSRRRPADRLTAHRPVRRADPAPSSIDKPHTRAGHRGPLPGRRRTRRRRPTPAGSPAVGSRARRSLREPRRWTRTARPPSSIRRARTPLVAADHRLCAATSFPPGRPIVEAAADLMTPHPRATSSTTPRPPTVSTPAAEAFAARRGVCQDFAHVMIAGLRGLGLPAAYVSGYLRTIPPPGQPRLRGRRRHPRLGLALVRRGARLDRLRPHQRHAGRRTTTSSWPSGRDYSDVAPIDGIILAPGEQTLKVEVDVIPEDEPVALADGQPVPWCAERRHGGTPGIALGQFRERKVRVGHAPAP